MALQRVHRGLLHTPETMVQAIDRCADRNLQSALERRDQTDGCAPEGYHTEGVRATAAFLVGAMCEPQWVTQTLRYFRR